ncbi:hypothetical protein KIN20_012632 [Parelaphostrongylus tenuis]|uniref:NADH dehydrogenase [ubiquinone] iron-sulfur protein 5 n=1 Tax=Parelaphostrongylus tenuis TaxID=148309 RepID=A0AAD5MFH9_PARTN|nr:hypothetical protein KIN20_012632 [Parelaphostrongylus tenuis]
MATSNFSTLLLLACGRVCDFFKAQFFRCMEACGAKLGRLYCDLEHRDLKECVAHDKQKKRAAAIAAKRRQLYREGKLETPFLENHPPSGQFKPDHFEWNRIYKTLELVFLENDKRIGLFVFRNCC